LDPEASEWMLAPTASPNSEQPMKGTLAACRDVKSIGIGRVHGLQIRP